MVKFIKIGADRIKLDIIERYGIKFDVRYFVKDADELGVEVDGAIFDSVYTGKSSAMVVFLRETLS